MSQTQEQLLQNMDAHTMAWFLAEHAAYQRQYGGLLVPAAQLQRAADIIRELIGEKPRISPEEPAP